MARYDDLDTRTIGMAAVISSIVLFILILAGRAMAYAWQGTYEEELLVNARYETSENEIAAQKAVLTKTGKVIDPPVKEGANPTERNVMPIDKALQLIGKELSTQPKT